MTQKRQAVELARFQMPLRPCPYLATEMASLTYRILIGITAPEYDELIRRGWRRFGCEFFRPGCPHCTKCRSLRLHPQAFTPSRSQQRTWQHNTNIKVVVQRPTVTDDHVRLYNAYHHDMHTRRGWPRQTHTPETYYQSFLLGDWTFAREFRYYDDDRLMGVGLADVTPTALSSVYFFHDPAWRPQAPGVFSILRQIAYAQELGLRYHYLGYWIPENPSMAYKSQYRPHEILARYPADSEEPEWVAPRVAKAAESSQ